MIALNAAMVFMLAASSGGHDLNVRFMAIEPDRVRYESVVQQIDAWDRTATTCTDQRLLDIANSIDSFEDPVRYWTDMSVYGWRHLSIAHTYRMWYADMALRMADTMAHLDCPDEANKVYRTILTNYSEPAYQGFRDRAMVGIQSVKENASNP